jgi:hypothetical protein
VRVLFFFEPIEFHILSTVVESIKLVIRKEREMKWEKLKSETGTVMRTKVPGGWLVFMWYVDSSGLTFYPDPNHEWDGNSLS